ncbi:MAG TPA: type VI secretion system contractile sheath large subunit, partial [Verrucomicrobiae bacterium]|nr:type VI secretion system contractile sheath large subunit [Verrucomicrobiae bacterium]
MPTIEDPKSKPEEKTAGVGTIDASEALAATERPLRLKTDQDKREVRGTVHAIIERTLKRSSTTPIPKNVGRLIKELKAEIDRKISEQLNEILHHPDFQALEGTWRGLHYLINNTELEPDRLEVHVMNISKEELTGTLKEFEGDAWQQSPLYEKIYSQEFGVFGGRPFGCLMGDYYWNHSVEDVEALEGMSKVAAAAFAPFISSVDPALFGLEDWRELNKKKDLKSIFTNKKYLRWNKMRGNRMYGGTEDSLDRRFIGLTMPRVLAREPWGEGGRKVAKFEFNEDVTEHSK